VAENRILRRQITGRVWLIDSERNTLSELGQRLGEKALKDIASIVKPETILTWHRKLIARKFDGSTQRHYPGRPRINPAIEQLIYLVSDLIKLCILKPAAKAKYRAEEVSAFLGDHPPLPPAPYEKGWCDINKLSQV